LLGEKAHEQSTRKDPIVLVNKCLLYGFLYKLSIVMAGHTLARCPHVFIVCINVLYYVQYFNFELFFYSCSSAEVIFYRMLTHSLRLCMVIHCNAIHIQFHTFLQLLWSCILGVCYIS